MNISNTEQRASRISGQCRLLLLVQAFYLMGNAFSDLFLSVYLWKLNHNLITIAWFSAAQYVSMAVTFWVAGRQVKVGNKMNVLRLGVGVAALFYLLVLTLGSKAAAYMIPLGIVQGLAEGLFWVANNVIYFEVTDRHNRDRFNGWAGLLSSVSYMVAPWISGYLISRMTDANGYKLIFTLSLALFVAGTAASFFLKKRKAQADYHWLFGWRRLSERNGEWRRISLAMTAQGIREGVFSFAIGLIVYIVTKDEMKLGNYSLITSAVGFVSYYVAGRLFKRQYRLWGSLIGIAAIIVVIVPFYWKLTFTTLLLFGIGVGLFYPLYSIPLTSIVFDIIGRNEESANDRVEYIVLREMSLNAGRLFGTLAFICVLSGNPSKAVFSTMLLAIGSAPLAAWLLLRKWLRAQEPSGAARQKS